MDDAALRRLAYEKGAAHVKIEKTVLPMTNVRSEGISRLRSLDEKLKRWGETERPADHGESARQAPPAPDAG